ncbi:MAG: Maf family protein, partial [Clostridia bacterium]|nr:Maf family protein [Clostridia bacterium]
DYVRQLAILKGKSVIKDLNKKGIDTSDTLVISCDTVVVHNDKIIGKPKDLDDAYNTVMELSDSWHSVYSGLSLILNNKEYSGFDETKVKFVKIDPNEAKVYVESGEPMGKAGSYAIQMKGGAFVSGVEGDFNNIVGFPLTLFCKVLKEEFNISIFELGNL